MKLHLPFFAVLLVATAQYAGAQSTTGGAMSKPHIQATPLRDEHIRASGPRHAQRMGTTSPIPYDREWQPLLTPLTSPNEAPEGEAVEEMRREKAKLKFSKGQRTAARGQSAMKTTIAAPVVGTNFTGNSGSGSCPFDNTVAVGNNGRIVSLINSNIRVYSATGITQYSSSFSGFFNGVALSNNICDPKIAYDAESDRFIFYTQTCDAQSSTSQVLLAFSNTSDPTGTWTYYALPGDPLNNNSWWDYPKLAITSNEVFVSGNLFSNSGNFNGSVVYEINKNDGYNAAASLTYQHWSGFSNAFTIMPVGAGQSTNYGPGVYMVSTASGSSSSSQYHFYDITADMGSSINAYLVSIPSYTIGGDASQANGINLNVGDSRTQSGFYLNGTVHFVFHSDAGSGWNGINYNRLDVATLTNTHKYFDSVGVADLAYPSIASFATSDTDKTVAIAFLSANPNGYPSIGAVVCDHAMNFSPAVMVKAGTGGVDACSSGSTDPERWGDYSGISRKHNSATPSVWLAGQRGNTSNYWNTHIAELHAVGTTTAIAPVEEVAGEASVYPVPVLSTFVTKLILKESGEIAISIKDVTGRTVRVLYEGRAVSGVNEFTFNKGMLQPGTYILQITNQKNQTIHNEKIIIGD